MKKITTYLFAATIAIVSLSSCSIDDNNNAPMPEPQPVNLLLGKWDMKKMDMKIVVDGDVMIDEKDVDTKGSGITVQYDFKADKTFEYYMFTPANPQQAEQEQSGTGTYTHNGDEIIMTINSPTTYRIKILSGTELHLNMNEAENVNGLETEIDMTQKFTKM